MKILWIFLGFITKLTIFRIFLCILGSFLKVKVQNGVYIFFGCSNFKYFLGVLEIPDIFGGERWMLGPSLRMKKK